MADVIVSVQQLDEVRIKFTELGEAIAETQRTNEAAFGSMVDMMSTGLSGVVEEVSDPSKLQDATKMAGMSDAYVSQVAREFSKVSGQLQKSVESMQSTVSGTQTGFENLDRGSKKLLLKLAKEDLQREKSEKPGLVKRIGRKEWSTFKGSISSALSKMMIPSIGGVAAGALGIMFYGYKDADRVRYEAGEVKNILIAAYDDGVKGAVQKGTRHLSSMQESLQKYLGINKAGVQAVTQAFVDGGLSVTQMLSKVKYSIGNARDSVLSTTFALDRMFELPNGSSAKRVVSFMSDYGKSTDDALDSVVRLQMLGRDSGIGAAQYVKNVEGAAQSLSKMGFNIDNVVDIYDHVTKSFSNMGVPKQFAGKQAALGMQQVAGGIEKMGDDWKVIIGERLGYGTGYEAKQKMMDAFLRVREGDAGNEVLKIIEVIYNISMEATGGDEAKAREFMEKKVNIGFEGARLVTKVMEDVKSGNLVKAAKAAKENSELLRKSLGVEAQKTSKFERMMNTWMKGLAKLGQGLLGWTLRTVAMILAYIRASVTMLENAITGDEHANKAIVESIDKMLGTGEGSKRKMAEGLDQMINAARRMGSDILGDSLQTLKSAVTYDPMREASLNLYYKDEQSAGRGISAEQEELQREFQVTPPKGQIIKRDSSSPGGYRFANAGSSAPAAQPPGGQYFGGGDPSPMGGYGSGGSFADMGGYTKEDSPQFTGGSGFNISSRGVNSNGDITLALGGSCPKCGYQVGSSEDGAYSEGGASELDVLTRMLYSEGGPGKIWKKGGKQELAGIAYTALNRRKQGMGGDNLMDIITRGHGYGKQGDKRPYSTARNVETPKNQKEYDAVRKLAGDILQGEVANPVGDATHFLHNTFGKGYGNKRNPVALPKFADPNQSRNKNVANIGTARFYGSKGADVEDRSRMDQAYRDRFKKRYGNTTGGDYYPGVSAPRDEGGQNITKSIAEEADWAPKWE